MKERFREHRLDVKNKIKKPTSIAKSKVAEHFSSNGHSEKDMIIAGFKHVINDIDREIEEARLIYKLGSYRPEGMNVDYHFLNLV